MYNRSILEVRWLKTEIIKQLKIDKQLFYNELIIKYEDRSGVYKSKLVQLKYEESLYSKPKRIKTNIEIKNQIFSFIEQDYSPEQVSGFVKKNYLKTFSH